MIIMNSEKVIEIGSFSRLRNFVNDAKRLYAVQLWSLESTIFVFMFRPLAAGRANSAVADRSYNGGCNGRQARSCLEL